MPSNNGLLATILEETLACQDRNSAEFHSRQSSVAYPPFGPFIEGGYPTTDAAMSALADLADRVRENDPTLRLAIGRDQMRGLTSRVVGELLNELAREP